MIIHTVQAGDTVYQIAKKYNVSPTKILEDNDLIAPNRLVVGQTLVILFPTKSYTVKAGDTLSSIASQFKVSVRSLYQNNPALGGEDSIYVGQVLTIEYPARPYGSISVNGYAYPGIPLGNLRRALPYLTYLTVFSARVRSDGALVLPDDQMLVTEARKYGVAPILLLTNTSQKGGFSSTLAREILSDPSVRVKMTEEIKRALNERGYAGVEFDFEYVPADLAETYANLVEDIRQRLGAQEYCVFAALAPKYYDSQIGILYEGHSYSSLGEAANGIRLMTYEWGYTYGPPMAVAPLPEVRRVAEYAKTRIPRDKLTLGIPSYGYDWTLPYTEGTRARSLGNTEAVDLAARVGASIEFDTKTQTPFFTYYDVEKSPAVEHIVHFEDARSVRSKLDLIDSMGLSGVGLWNLMRPFPQFFTVLNALFETVLPFPCSSVSK